MVGAVDVAGSFQVVLQLHRSAPNIHGWVEDAGADGQPVEFYGWIQLSALLDDLCTQHEDERIALACRPGSPESSA